MAWITFSSVSVSNGAVTATVNSAEDIALLEMNAGLIIGELAPVAIKRAYLGAGDSKVIELFAPWPHATQANKAARVFNTDAGLPEATAALNAATELVKGDFPEVAVVAENIAAVQSAATNMAAIIAAPAEAAKAKTEADKAATSALSMTAMTQAQFEAIRAANNEEFAASGFVHFGKHRNNTSTTTAGTPVNEGLWAKYDSTIRANSLCIGAGPNISFLSGASKFTHPVINIAGVIFNCIMLNETSVDINGTIKFPSAPDGKTTYNKSTGVITTHATTALAFAAQTADPTNVEVVTDRVDMWGFETWLEEVNATNPFVYPNGLIQSQAATMDGITTTASARPVTYYAVFDGDTGSKGKGLNFFALTDAQKKKVLGNHKNNLYYLDDGRLVQWRLRQRSFAGAGNGDWGNVDCVTDVEIRFTTASMVRAQGFADVVTTFVNSTDSNRFTSSRLQLGARAELGLFVNRAPSTLVSVSGECYFLVCGTVNRLNQGAYHPSFNPNGTACMGGTVDPGSSFDWHSSFAKTANSLADCFGGARVTSAPIAGSIAGTAVRNGRPDDRYYDAIYPDGFGGVCRDMRYSANGLELIDFAEADQRVKNGSYRGFEKAVFTQIATGRSTTVTNYISFGEAKPIVLGDISSGSVALNRGSGYKAYRKLSNGAYKELGVYTIGYTASASIGWFFRVCELDSWGSVTLIDGALSSADILVVSGYLPSTIGGSFLQTDVIGNPANILATPQLANGWQGSWIPTLPTGAVSAFQAARESIATANSALRSTNNGTAWSVFTPTFDTVKNEVTLTNEPATNIVILQYQANAKITKPAVSGVAISVGEVSATTHHDKANCCLLAESAAGLILKNNTGISQNTKMLLTKSTDSTGKLTSASTTDGVTHSALTLGAPANSSAGFKALNYNVAVNQQGFINYAYTELKHNGANWGDDGKVTIADNQTTKTDLNGNTVLVGTAQTCEPVGWLKVKL